MSANFWFATAKVLHFFELRKSSVKKNRHLCSKHKWHYRVYEILNSKFLINNTSHHRIAHPIAQE